jgi:hypothetical protein
MLDIKGALASGAVAVSALLIGTVVGAPGAMAQCVNKAGEGTGGSRPDAVFQAYEAILQATDWGMWATWMATGPKVGTAPGYAVSKMRQTCKAGGLGQVCTVQATLCKR